MDELTILHDAFGPDEVPSPAAETLARTALRERMSIIAAPPGPASERRHVRPGRRPRRIGIAVAIGVAAALAVTGVVVVRHVDAAPDGYGTGGAPAAVGTRPQAAVPPFARPANAAQYLENAAWSAETKPWVSPRPDQFMYNESLVVLNSKEYMNDHPNNALRPGKTHTQLMQEWKRIDGKELGHISGGKLVVEKQGQNGGFWAQLNYSELEGLTTPEKVRYWHEHPTGSVSADLDAILGQYVLPPAVQAAVFRALAQEPGMHLNPDAVNLDGRPAVGLGRVIEGYLSQELLFDTQTYALIGERLVAIKDHVTHGDDGDLVAHKGDIFRQATYTKAVIVDHAGDTR